MYPFKKFITEMSIHDDRHIQNTKWSSRDELQYWLKDNNWTRVGKGYFASVWRKGTTSKRVLKISEGDNAWLAYAMWTLTQTNNPYVPDIKWIKHFSDDTGKKVIVAPLEVLEKFEDKHIKRMSIVELCAFLTEGYFTDEITNAFKKHIRKRKDFKLYIKGEIKSSKPDNSKIIAAARAIPNSGLHESTSMNVLAFAEKITAQRKHHPLIETFKKIKTIKRGLDLHGENIMWRASTKTPVITDPVAFGISTDELTFNR